MPPTVWDHLWTHESSIFSGASYTAPGPSFQGVDLKKLNSNQPTIPSTLGQEIKTNIFLRCNDPEIKHAIGLKDSSELEVFSKLRDLKDTF